MINELSIDEESVIRAKAWLEGDRANGGHMKDNQDTSRPGIQGAGADDGSSRKSQIMPGFGFRRVLTRIHWHLLR